MRFAGLKASALSEHSGKVGSLFSKTKNQGGCLSRAYFSLALLLMPLAFPLSTAAVSPKEVYPDSHLSLEAQALLSKASRHLKSKSYNKALSEVESLSEMSLDGEGLAFATSELASNSAQGNKLVRVLINKALSLDIDVDSLSKMADSARESECFDLYRAVMDKLISKTTKVKDLLELATRAHRTASMDTAHLALQKALKVADNQPDVLDFIGTAFALGVDDIAIKGMKELIDDQETATELVELACRFEPFKNVRAVRFALQKALDKASSVQEFVLIYNAANKYGQADIAKLAKWRGKKKGIMDQLKDEQANSLEEQEKRVQEDLKRLRSQPAGF